MLSSERPQAADVLASTLRYSLADAYDACPAPPTAAEIDEKLSEKSRSKGALNWCSLQAAADLAECTCSKCTGLTVASGPPELLCSHQWARCTTTGLRSLRHIHLHTSSAKDQP